MSKIKNCAIIAATSFVMVGIIAGAGFAYGPHHKGFRGNDDINGVSCSRENNFNEFLVKNGIPAETVNAFIADKNKFRTDNQDALQNMRAKGLELREEMSKAAPDANQAKALQAEFSKLRTDFDAKRSEHMLYLKATYPEICEIMHKKFQDKDSDSRHNFGPAGKHRHGDNNSSVGKHHHDDNNSLVGKHRHSDNNRPNPKK